MDTSDGVNDVMVIMTDGWDSDMLTVQDNINAAGADGITTLAIGFGAGGFYNEWSLLDMAQGNPNNLFIVSLQLEINSDGDKIFIQAQTPEALESITQSVFDGVCTANAMQARSLTMSYGPVEPENVFLMQAAASYLDVFGVLPSWAPIE